MAQARVIALLVVAHAIFRGKNCEDIAMEVMSFRVVGGAIAVGEEAWCWKSPDYYLDNNGIAII